jgi:raffinose/stachyose/melibiose transport system permease protein
MSITAERQRTADARSRPAAARRARRRSRATPWLFLAPLLALMVGFRLIPTIDAVRLSFYHWDGISPPAWVGFRNYSAMWHDPAFRHALRNNGLILLTLPVWVILPLAVAVGLRERVRGWRIFRFAYFIPCAISPLIVGELASLMLRYDGPVNRTLHAAGLGALVRQWLADPSLALWAMMAVIIWANFGTGVLIYLAGMATIDESLYDAARIDGASRWRQHWHVTLPQLRQVIEFYGVIVLIGAFAAMFPYVYSLTGGGPGTSTYTVEFDIYEQAFGQGELGYGSAVGVVLLLLLLVLVIAALRIFRVEEER